MIKKNIIIIFWEQLYLYLYPIFSCIIFDYSRIVINVWLYNLLLNII